MTKKQEQADYEAEVEAEKAAEAKYPTEKPVMPERFETGGASYAEREAWIKENWPEPLVETAKCGPPDGEGSEA